LEKRFIIDYVTGQKMPDVGAEANRQAVERFLVDRKDFQKNDIEVNTPLQLEIQGQIYRSRVDLLISIQGRGLMAIKCAAGSLGSREREIVAAARLLDVHQIPLSMVSDGKTAFLLDTLSGRKVGEGMDAIPSRNDLLKQFGKVELKPLDDSRREKEMLIFRSYDSMTVNII